MPLKQFFSGQSSLYILMTAKPKLCFWDSSLLSPKKCMLVCFSSFLWGGQYWLSILALRVYCNAALVSLALHHTMCSHSSYPCFPVRCVE